MTAQEMQKYVLQQINAMEDNVTIPSEDVILYINKAIDQFVKTRLEPRNNRQQLGFEQSQIRIDDLRELITESGALDTIEVEVPFVDNYFIDKASIPANYMFLIHTSADINYNRNGVTYTVSNDKRIVDGVLNTDYGTKKASCKFIQLDDIQAVISDPFKKTDISDPKYTVNGNNIYVYTDQNFIVDKVYLTYIRQPAKVSLAGNGTDCDLAVSTHEDIVDLAVNLIAQDRGVQTPNESD